MINKDGSFSTTYVLLWLSPSCFQWAYRPKAKELKRCLSPPMRVANKLTPEPKRKTTENKPEHKSEQFQDKTLQLLVPNTKKLGGYTQKIPRSATWFRSGKHSDDACSCSTRLEGTRQGFQNSTMKCLGACRCETYGIPRKEGRRSSLIRILPL